MRTAGAPDFVLDCIDNIDTKVELLRYCVQRGLRVVSSMGAGAKGDPSCIQVADMADTQGRCAPRQANALGVVRLTPSRRPVPVSSGPAVARGAAAP